MRVGQASHSSHQAGMGALWHDVDYIPEKRFETPVIHKGLDDMALPSEQHQLPDGVADPFKKLDEIYDIAAAQMDRGLKGQNFLNGVKPPSSAQETSNPRERHDDVVARVQQQSPMKGGVIDNKIVESIRTDLEQVRMTNQAAVVTIPKSKGATKTAAEGEAQAAAPAASNVGDALGAAATFIPMAAGQAISSVAQGPLPAMATQAVTVTAAAVSAAQVVSVGVAEGLREDSVTVRRGLAKKA